MAGGTRDGGDNWGVWLSLSSWLPDLFNETQSLLPLLAEEPSSLSPPLSSLTVDKGGVHNAPSNKWTRVSGDLISADSN